MEFWLKGILIGIIFGVPVGTIGTMVTQRTLVYGKKAGLITGLGSSMADVLYAIVGAFGITYITDFLLEYEVMINILGGIFLLIMGIGMYRKQEEQIKGINLVHPGKLLLPSFLIGITSPVAILTFIFAFSYFEIPSPLNIIEGSCLVVGVFLGTFFWWITLSLMVARVKQKSREIFENKNRVFGIIYILFGLLIFIRSVD